MYYAAVHKTLTQTIDLSQLLWKQIVQERPLIINKMTKWLDKKTLQGLEQVNPNKSNFFPSVFFVKDIFCRLIFSSWSVF